MQPMMMMSMIFGLLAYGMYRISKGEMENGTLLSFLMYLFNLIGALPSIATLFSELAKASGSTERVQGILDEATASIDSESEMMVQKKLANLMENRTTLVIAHRLSTIVDSDVIYFIEKGTITGSGNHENLVAEHKTYARYVSEQFKLNQD